MTFLPRLFILDGYHSIHTYFIENSAAKSKSNLYEASIEWHNLTMAMVDLTKIVSEYDQEIPQSQTADKPMASRGRLSLIKYPKILTVEPKGYIHWVSVCISKNVDGMFSLEESCSSDGSRLT